MATYIGNMKIVLLLIQNGANIYTHNYIGENLIHQAVKNCQLMPIILFSKELNLDQPNDLSLTPLMIAASQGDNYIVEFLISE